MAPLNPELAAGLLRKLIALRGKDEGFVAAEFIVEDIPSDKADDAKTVDILVVTVEDRSKFSFPEEMRIDFPDFLVRIEEGAPVKLFAPDQSRLPVPPRGKITGGDAIWNPNGGWGTMAFATPKVTFMDHLNARHVVNNAVVSCNHILAMLDLALPNDQIVTFRKQTDLWLDYYWPVLDTMIPPVDVAVGQSTDLTAFAPNEVRGLGKITGVAATVNRERVFKCGAATSITTARDDGVGAIQVPYYNNRSVILRKTTRDFADVGDSGSAVLNAKRELVGFVVAGRQSAAGIITYYLPTAPLAAPAGGDPLLRLSLS